MQLTFGNNIGIVRASAVKVPDYMRNRLSTGIDWFDRASGSDDKPGFIAGSVKLLYGDPGSGKSTLMRQVASVCDFDVLMNLGEECFEQVKMGLEDRMFGEEFDLSNFTNVDDLLTAVEAGKYQIVVVDSIQNLFSRTDSMGNELKAGPGSPKQLVACTEKIYAFAKRTLTAFYLICHSTKGGDFKGGQTMEHIIDATIKISVEEVSEVTGEGEETEVVTLCRTLEFEKNRFGMTHIPYHLAMTQHGLSLTDDPKKDEAKAPSSKKGAVKAAAQKLAKKGLDRSEFINTLVDETDCSPATATMYHYQLNR